MMRECGCCEGIEGTTPEQTANRPGLSAITFRVGTHASFYESMVARLPLVGVGDGDDWSAPPRPLARLTTRDPSDPTLAFLDAWASVADVLTFYQERIANEGYLRTAIERRSTLELARLIGYAPRPGVAASTFFAFLMENGYDGEIPAGTRAQSLPKPGETPQVFESSEPVKAKFVWNALKPRLTKRQDTLKFKLAQTDEIYFAGLGLNLKKGDIFLIRLVAGQPPVAYTAVLVREETLAQRTAVQLTPFGKPPNESTSSLARVVLQPFNNQEITRGVVEKWEVEEGTPVTKGTKIATVRGFIVGEGEGFFAEETQDVLAPVDGKVVGRIKEQTSVPLGGLLCRIDTSLKEDSSIQDIADIVARLSRAPGAENIAPRDRAALPQKLREGLASGSNASYALLGELRPELRALFRALRTIHADPEAAFEVYVMRVTAAAFGNNAAEPFEQTTDVMDANGNKTGSSTVKVGKRLRIADDESGKRIFLDAAYPGILPGSQIMVVNPNIKVGLPVVLAEVTEALVEQRTAYGISGKTTRLELDTFWWSMKLDDSGGNPFDDIRKVVVYAQSERLELAEEPNTDAVEDDVVELDTAHDGLEPGRWVLITGERVDIPGYHDGELVIVSAVEQVLEDGPLEQEAKRESLSAANPRTRLRFGNELLHSYKRDTVTLFGNVARATHGETRSDVLGSGDGSRSLQAFDLKQSPLTYVSAPTVTGAESTLAVRVDGVLWREVESIAQLGPTDRVYVTRTGDDGKTKVIGGTGWNGARFSTGVENVTAQYRTGIGVAGNVAASQISLLMTRPLGLRGVTNPLPARGGADRESRDKIRENAPLAVLSLDRLVSVQDYADFARTFAGVGKAAAERSTANGQPTLRVVITGTTETRIDANTDVHRNLLAAFERFGAPFEPVTIEPHRPVLLFLSVKVKIRPEYQWSKTEPKIRSALLEAFGFERRKLGEDAILSEVIAAIHRLREVDYVDVDAFGGVRETPPPGAGGKQASSALSPAIIADQIAAQLEEQEGGVPEPRVRVDRLSEVAYFTPFVPETLALTELSA